MERQLSPALLPIAKYEKQIMSLIDRGTAVVISGKTGCGKSTQVPQYILRSHPNAKIAICQPRRVAATSLAVRVSEEMSCKLGSKVGYHIGMESFRDQRCSIVYMTYGILIQQLLFMENIPFTHIILDEIHERSLEMDFTFVALKKIINGKYKQKIKLVVMSATLNAELFCDYFCSDSDGNFYLTELKEADAPKQQSRRGRNRQVQKQPMEHFQAIPPGSNFKPALQLQLQEQRMFKVEQFYLDDLNQNDFYFGEEEQRITEEMFNFAVNLIQKLRKNKKEGDYLVFLPGLFEIKAMKAYLIKSQFPENQIIEVHSLFSDELYHSLFDAGIKNKIILATNIGESSITLPFCRVVIDFCLSRKNYSKDRGVTRLETRLASQANMIQRSGRVGRVSDGVVYRMVTRELYQKLSQYEKPEIQCVSLEMIILRVKQLDLMNKNDIFKNPYYFLMSTISPPDLQDIRKSLEILIHQEALMSDQPQSTGVRQADALYLTDIGKFMVQMPCELRISKMILMGLKIRIPEKIIAVASILMLTKQFFLHEERRYNIEEFMHSLVGYDRGYFNDYTLRQNLFSHWKQEFYDKVKEKKLFQKKFYLKGEEKPSKKEAFQRIYSSQQGAEEILSFLEEFNQQKWSEKEKDWCFIRGVSPNSMRELIRIEENLKLRVCAKNFNLIQKQHPSNELVLLCLEYGFPENDCQIRWNDLSRESALNPNEPLFYIDLPMTEETSDDAILDYIRPEKNYKIEVINEKNIKRIYGSTSILSKFILPKHYSKAQTKNTSDLYRFLSKTNINHHFSYEMVHKYRPLTILNESICKSCLPYNSKSKFKLLTHKFTETGNKKMTNMGAIVEDETYFMMQIILKKKMDLILHPSDEYFCGFRANDQAHQMSSALDSEQVSGILYYRSLISHGKQSKINSSQEMLKHDDLVKLVRLLKGDDVYTSVREVWQYRYEIQLHGQYHDRYFSIDKLPPLKQKSDYHSKYKEWKTNKYYQFYNIYRPLIMENICVICKQCHPREIVEIEHITAYNHLKNILLLNQYSGSWKIVKKDLCCKYGHEIGEVVDDDHAEIHKKGVLLYIPYKRVEELWDSEQWRTQEVMEEMVAAGRLELQHAKHIFEQEECIFCFEYMQNTGEPVFKKFEKDELGRNYLKKYMDHMRSQQHLNNVAKFRKTIDFDQKNI